MRPEYLEELVTRKGELEKELARLEKELAYVDGIITIHQPNLPRGELRIIRRTKQTRVRGVFKAAKKAVESFSEPFDKNQLLAKLVEIDQNFANKKISGASIRNTLRLLKQNGIIRVERAASATECATFVRAA